MRSEVRKRRGRDKMVGAAPRGAEPANPGGAEEEELVLLDDRHPTCGPFDERWGVDGEFMRRVYVGSEVAAIESTLRES
jgi:hypothetical protein